MLRKVEKWEGAFDEVKRWERKQIRLIFDHSIAVAKYCTYRQILRIYT
jgi:hypothetical protein